jgi:hypothetical protein
VPIVNEKLKCGITILSNDEYMVFLVARDAGSSTLIASIADLETHRLTSSDHLHEFFHRFEAPMILPPITSPRVGNSK